MTTRIDTVITAVTVYPGQARITRRGVVPLEAGERRVAAGGLPFGLRPDSVRVTGRGPATVLGVDVGTERNPRSPDVTIEELEQRRDELDGRLAELDDEAAVLTARQELLSSLSRRSGAAFAKALATDSVDVSRVSAVSDGLAEQLGGVLTGRRELTERRRDVEREVEEVARRLNDRLTLLVPDRRVIAVDLAVDEAAELELEFSYLVDDARWESRYDVRLRAETLTLTWFGLITQNSGEDWPECDLRLSTARPAGSVTVPELDPWYLRRAEPPVPLPARSMAYDAAVPAMVGERMVQLTGGSAGFAAAAPKIAVSTAAMEQGATAATYQPARRIAVPADGTAHRTTVLVAELPARLDHVTVPLRGPEAYLRATAVNTSDHTLRPGPASIFHEAEFVGTTALEPWAPGEEVELALGVDDRVRVERELTRRAVGKAVLGGTRRHEAAYRIAIGNYGPRTANVTVVDQLPVSTDEAITVRDTHCDPKPAEQTDLGEVTWKLELAPNKTAKLTMEFRVDVAKGVKLAGWRD